MYLVKHPELCRVFQGELLSAGLSKHAYTAISWLNSHMICLATMTPNTAFIGFFTHHILQAVVSSTPLWNTAVKGKGTP
jgi:hypothetical protein